MDLEKALMITNHALTSSLLWFTFDEHFYFLTPLQNINWR